MTQEALLCGCGSAQLFRKGLCVRCYRRARLSKERFGDQREQVLTRDRRRCVACRSLDGPLVHHRQPGVSQRDLMATLCRRCHCKVERTLRPRFGWPAPLRKLWREVHPGLAEQRELQLLPAGAPPDPPREQVPIFEREV